MRQATTFKKLPIADPTHINQTKTTASIERGKYSSQGWTVGRESA